MDVAYRSCSIFSSDEFHITIRSSTISTEDISNIVKNWEGGYHNSISPNKYLRFYSFTQNWASDDNIKYGNNVHNYFVYQIPPHITFSKLHFPGKEEIFKRLEIFMLRRAWYIHRQIPYNIGFFLHGHPSCGCEKTSTIKGDSILIEYTK